MGEMKRAGIIAVSDDGRPVPSAGVMRRAMEYARGFDLPVVDHCEDRSLTAGGVMHEGNWSLRLGLRGHPALAEEMDASRDIALAELTGARVHLAHVSTRGALEDEAVCDYDTNTKMCPPLRSHDHVEAILEALRDETIDAIATDHAPHHADEKALEYDQAPFGITGLETAIGLAFEHLVHNGVIGLERLVELCSVNPAKIFKLTDRGTLKVGAHGDVTILDPEHVWTFKVSASKSKSRNTPFDNWTMRGKAVATIVGGRVLYVHDEKGAAVGSQSGD
jgi:dihydroorotase